MAPNIEHEDRNTMKTKPTHGGKRKGAGRPPRAVPCARLRLEVEPELFAEWNEQRKMLGLSGPKFLAQLLKWKCATRR